MPTARLGAYNLVADTLTDVYSPSGVSGVVNLSICNRSNSNPTLLHVAIADITVAPTDAEWIEFGVVIGPNGLYERTGLAVGDGQFLVVKSILADVSAVVYGIEV